MTAQDICVSFRQARLNATALAEYPGGVVPTDLDRAYALQEAGIQAWQDQVRGWKVAAVQPIWRETYPAERLAGPVFSKTLWQYDGAAVSLPVIENGYAAVEAEFALQIAAPIPSTADFHSPEQLLPYVAAVHAAIELAASPLATLSALGPGAVISDFGNNSGLAIGPRLPLDLLRQPAQYGAVTLVNGQEAGSGNAARIPGGPLSALLFLVLHLRQRGRSLNTGDWVSTGAATGIHKVGIGDRVEARFCETAVIEGVIVDAKGLRSHG